MNYPAHVVREQLAAAVQECRPDGRTMWDREHAVAAHDMPMNRLRPLYRADDAMKAREEAIAYMLGHGIPSAVMFTRSRHPVLQQMREEVWIEMRRLGYSYPTIARACGFVHSTIIEGLQRHRATYAIMYPQPQEGVLV